MESAVPRWQEGPLLAFCQAVGSDGAVLGGGVLGVTHLKSR